MKLISSRSELFGSISIPASKSHTIRAVAIAAMADGLSVLKEPLLSEDAKSALLAAEKFGAMVTFMNNEVHIKGIGGPPRKDSISIDVGNSGTTLRIFTGLAALSPNKIHFDGDDSIRSRPMTNLFSALEKIGAKFDATNQKCPFSVTGPILGGKTIVNGISSQFLTALLFSTPLAENDTEIIVENLHEKPYVEITLDWLKSQDIKFEQKGLDWFKVKGKQTYKPFERRIPADFSSATFAACAAAITQSELLITGLDFSDHQGDKEIFNFLKEMGVKVVHRENGVIVKGEKIHGIEIDMNNTPDALPAMAVTACFAEGTTKLMNVAQARLKECDRIAAITKELRKMGASIEELPDGLIIQGSKLKGAGVHGYHDHRMVMALTLAGFGGEGLTEVDTAESVKITYPSFVADFKAIGGQLKEIDN